MFEGIADLGLVLLWLGGSILAGFFGGVISIYWTRRDE